MTRRGWGAVAVLTGGLVLGGCADAQPDLAADAAEDLQAAVVELAEASAQGRWDAAEEGVARVRAVLEEAAQEGDISVARYANVLAALERTEEELVAAQATDASAGAAETTGPDAAQGGDGAAPDASTDLSADDEDAVQQSGGAVTDADPVAPGPPAEKPGRGVPGREGAPGQDKGRGRG